MSAEERLSVRDSRDTQPFRRSIAPVQNFRQARVVNGDVASDGSPSSPFRPPPLASSVPAPGPVTDYIAIFISLWMLIESSQCTKMVIN